MEANVLERLLLPILKSENVLEPRLEISSAGSKGDGYLSVMIRVNVTGKNKDLYLILKCAPSNSNSDLQMFPVQTVYKREIFIYKEIIPTFQNIQKSLQIEQQFNGFIKCFQCFSIKGEEKIVLENITIDGFGLWNRMKLMSEEMVAFILKQYARFHGLSYALKDRHPEVFKSIVGRMSNMFLELFKSNDLVASYKCAFEYVLKVIQTKEDLLVYDTARRYSEKFVEYSVEKNIKERVAVITHGDCWCNNMMFKFGDKSNPTNPTEMKLLDFQLSNYGSPAYDLSYFLYLSAPKSVLDNLEDYLKIYYDSLTTFTKLLDTDVEKYLTFEELTEQWKPASKFGYNASVILIKMLYQEETEIVEFNDIASGKITIQQVHERKLIHEDVVQQRILEMTIHMYERGFFLD